ncbi:MAG: ubiquinol-cytochrome C chaperone family protein [Hyphomonadaceae bacterium]
MPIWPFGRSLLWKEADALVSAVTAASRQPDLFGAERAPDTLEGRFEVMTAHAALALVRLEAEPGAARLSQAFADVLFRFFDAGLREAGASDTAVPKRMRKLARDFYGRVGAYAAALADAGTLEQALARNIWGAETHPFAPALAARLAGLARLQGQAPVSALRTPQGWALP